MRGVGRAGLGIVALAAVAAGAITGVGARQKAATDIPAGVAGRHVEVEGVPIRVVQLGSGPDVLLVHGSPGTLEDWEPVLGRLAGRFRVTAFDRPGHGYSGGVELAHTPQANAALASGLIRALGLRDVVFVGHSFGGATGLALAIRDPGAVRALVLVGARAYRPVRVEPLYRLLALSTFGRGMATLLAPLVGPARIREGVMAAFGPNAGAIPPDFVARRTPLWTRPTVSATLSQERTTLGSSLEELEPHYAAIRVPVTIVCGEQDPNHADAVRLAHDIPGSRLVLLPNTGHYVQYARPQELTAAIEAAE